MKVDLNINHEGNGMDIFGITPARFEQIADFLQKLVADAAEKKYRRSQIIVKIVEFAENPIEAVVIFGYLEDRKRMMDKIKNVVRDMFEKGTRRPGHKTGCIEIVDGEIQSITGDEIPDELVNDLDKIVEQLKFTRPTGNMKVDGDGKIS